ncbi:NALCN channel auxiliary factor 2 [Ambystoma mexicanum]|uniref:NALCN channel auxiliary factor 2 n=1 Tax=Ambystoma mexicanum TaxID=8296 RepID=UPI0037E7E0E9
MISGTWMYPREDEAALKICRAPQESEPPRASLKRAQQWRLSPAYLLFLTALLSDQLWLCAGARPREKARGLAQEAVQGAGTPANRNPSCDTFLLGNLSRSVAATPPMLPCFGAPLDSACTKLHSLQRLWGALSPPSPSFWPPSAPTSSFFSFSSKRNFLKAYFRNFSLPFCDTYSMADLLLGMAAPEGQDCSLESLMGDFAVAAAFSSSSATGPLEGEVCGSCVRAYQSLDQHAQEKYEEFDSVLDKYLQSDEYSVRSCVGDCKAVYKAWLCSEYFNVTQRQCRRHIPCKQYCLEVQTRCPFVLPDNDDLIYGGLPGFICTGLLENQLSNAGAQCCDVRWRTCNLAADGESNTTAKPKDSESFYYHHNSRHRHQHHHHRDHHLHPYHHHHQPSLLPVSAGSRLGHSKLRLCVLVLVLLHTMTSFSTVQSNNGMSLEALPALDENTAREE